MRYLMAGALFLMLAGGFAIPLSAQDAQKKQEQKKEAEEVKPVSYKAGISGMR